MASMTGSAFTLTRSYLQPGSNAVGTVITGSDVKVSSVMTKSDSGAFEESHLNAWVYESFLVDSDDDGRLGDEARTTITTIERYGAKVTLEDGTSFKLSGAVGVVSLSNGSQHLVFRDSGATQLNSAGSDIHSIEFTSYDTTYNGELKQANFSNNLTAKFAEPQTFEQQSAKVACFCLGTRMLTPKGYQRIENLRNGETIINANGHAKRILWIGKSEFQKGEVQKNPKLEPIKISKGALGYNVPNRTVWVSRQHRIWMNSSLAQNEYGDKGVLVAAKDLIKMKGVQQVHGIRPIGYVHVLLENHDLIISEGMVSESFYLAPQSFELLAPDLKASISKVYKEDISLHFLKKTVCPIAKGRNVKDLIAKHTESSKALQIKLNFAKLKQNHVLIKM